MENARALLKKHWKHDQFRSPQDLVIQAVLQGRDSFVLLPTGGGKSICFQIPALLMDGLCLVISPLVALIQDQVSALKSKGIKAAGLFGGMHTDEIISTLDNCLYGGTKFLYLSPERLQQDWVLDRIQKLKINSIAVDEAHCISQWGHEFRPAYLKISKLKDLFPDIPFIALTASANQRVQDDICQNLQLQEVAIFKKSFYRANLIYGVYAVESKEVVIEKMLVKHPAPSIVFTRSRRGSQELAAHLEQRQFSTSFFHGGLSGKEKKKKLQLWLEEKLKIMVATNAFGMGIDKDNVKNVIHIDLPENLESYYQEAGRAGRNGQKAFASILLAPTDLERAKRNFNEALFDSEFLKLVYKKLNNYFQIAYGEGYESSHSFSFNRFCQQYQLPSKKTYNALQFLDQQSIVKLSSEFGMQSRMQFLADTSELLDYVESSEKEEILLLNLLRNYPGIHEFETQVNLEFLARKTELTTEEIADLIQIWTQKNLCTFSNQENDLNLVFNETREDEKTLIRTFAFLKQQNKIKKQQFEALLFYVENTDICKNRILLNYFDEKREEDCGTCSTCKTRKKNLSFDDLERTQKSIIRLLQQSDLSSEELEIQLNIDSEELLAALKLLLEFNQIKPNSYNKYTYIK